MIATGLISGVLERLPLGVAFLRSGYGDAAFPHEFPLALAVLLLVPLLFRRLRLPGLIGLILAGAVLGPSGADLIPHGGLVEQLGGAGWLYLLFRVGLDVDLRRFRREPRLSIVFGLWTFLLPLIVGMLGAVLLVNLSWPEALLLGGMFAFHTPIAFPIVQRLGLVKERVVAAAAGGTLLTDTLALLVLVGIAESAFGMTGPSPFLGQVLRAGVYVALVIWGVPVLSRWCFWRIGQIERKTGFLFVLALVFGVAALAPVAGLQPAIGAFLAGLALNRVVPEEGRLMTRLRFAGDALFVPFFLLSVGLQVDATRLTHPGPALHILLYMVTAGVAVKFLAAVFGARMLRFSRAEAGVLFGLSVTRSAALLAAAMVGIELGVFSEDILNGALGMILASCLIGPWAVERYGQRLKRQVKAAEDSRAEAPERIMIPLVHSHHGDALLALAARIRDPLCKEALYPVMIAPDNDAMQAALGRAEETLAALTDPLAAEGILIHSLVRLSSHADEELLCATRDLRISTLVLDDGMGAPHDLECLPDRLTEQGRQMVFRFVRPAEVQKGGRFLAAVPPLVERQPGFAAVWQSLRRLARHSDASLLVMAEAGTIQAMVRQKLLDPAPGEAQVPMLMVEKATWDVIESEARIADGERPHADQRIELACWSDMPDQMRIRLGEHDLGILVLAREGRFGWREADDDLPGLMKARFPERPFLMVYPAETEWEALPLAGQESVRRFRSLFPPQHVFLNRQEATVPELLRGMIAAVYPDQPRARAKLLQELELMARHGALRLPFGGLLLHSRQAPPPAPMVLLATRHAGFDLSGDDKPDAERSRVVILVLSGVDESPETHLQHLAAVASLLRGEGVVACMAEAACYQDLVALQQGTPEKTGEKA